MPRPTYQQIRTNMPTHKDQPKLTEKRPEYSINKKFEIVLNDSDVVPNVV